MTSGLGLPTFQQHCESTYDFKSCLMVWFGMVGLGWMVS